MVTGSSRGPGNEVNFVMQKFARAVLGITTLTVVRACDTALL